MEYAITVCRVKSSPNILDPGAKQFFRPGKWKKLDDCRILLEDTLAFTHANGTILIGASGMMAYVQWGGGSERHKDVADYLNYFKHKNAGGMEKKTEANPPTPANSLQLPREVVETVRNMIAAFTISTVNAAHSRLLSSPPTPKSAKTCLNETAGLIRLMELQELHSPDMARRLVLERHMRLAGLLDHRTPTLFERLKTGFASMTMNHI